MGKENPIGGVGGQLPATKGEFLKLADGDPEADELKDEETPEETKPEARAEEKPEVKPEEKPAAEVEEKPEEKTEVKAEETPTEKPGDEAETDETPPTSESDPGKPADPKQAAGLINDLRKTRGKLKDQGLTIAQQNDHIAFLQGQLANQNKGKDKEELAEDVIELPADDEPLTGKDLKNILSRAQRQESANEAKRALKAKDGRFSGTEVRAKETYSEAKVGKDLTYEAVKGKARELLHAMPEANARALVTIIDNCADPAEMLYNLGKTHPDVIKSLSKAGVKQVVDKITEPKPKTLPARGAISAPKLTDLSPKDVYTNEKVTPEALIKEAEAEEK